MLRGLYTATAGMITNQRRHDTVTNNIANVNTPGYKQVNAVQRSFPEMLVSLMNANDARPSIGRLNLGVMVEENIESFVQGDLQETGKSSDFALVSNIQVMEEVDGEQVPIAFDANGRAVDENGNIVYQPQAFFTVWTEEDEPRYSRNGQFRTNENGDLLTLEGYRVLGRNGEPINLSDVVVEGLDDNVLTMDQIQVLQDGTLTATPLGNPVLGADGEPIRLLISQVNNPNMLIKEGNGLYRLSEGADAPEQVQNMGEIAVYQGFVERSNVDPTQQTIDMMSAARAYEANQKVVQFYDSTLQKAVNDIGRV